MRKLFAGLIAATSSSCSGPGRIAGGAQGARFQHHAVLAASRSSSTSRTSCSHGPVVLYFFPKAFTSGCTAEAHAFSEAAASSRSSARG